MKMHAKPTSNGINILTFFGCLYFVSCIYLGTKMHYTGDLTSVFPENFIDRISAVDFLIIALACVLVFLAILGVQRLVSRMKNDAFIARTPIRIHKRSHKADGATHTPFAIAGVCFLVVYLSWLAVFAAYFPGTSMNDQILIVDNFVENATTHPIIYCILLSSLTHASIALFGVGTYGFAVFVLARMGICALIVALICLWFHKRGVKAYVLVILTLFFALTPVIQNYAICSIKDTLFSFVLLAWFPLLWDMAKSKGEILDKKTSRIAFVVLCVATALTRNNGIAISVLMIVVVLVFLLACKRTTHVKPLLAASALSIVLILLPACIVAPLAGVGKASFAEAVNIPLQQVAAVVSTNRDIPDQDQRRLAEVFPVLEDVHLDYMPAMA